MVGAITIDRGQSTQRRVEKCILVLHSSYQCASGGVDQVHSGDGKELWIRCLHGLGCRRSVEGVSDQNQQRAHVRERIRHPEILFVQLEGYATATEIDTVCRFVMRNPISK